MRKTSVLVIVACAILLLTVNFGVPLQIGTVTQIINCDSASGWSCYYGEISLDTADYVEGTGSVKGEPPVGHVGGTFMQKDKGDGVWDLSYRTTLKAKIKITGIASSDGFNIQLLNNVWSTVAVVSVFSQLIDDEWVEVTADYSSYAATTDLSIIASIQFVSGWPTAPADASVHVDDVRLVETEAAPVSVSVSPASAAVTVGESKTFFATAAGGTGGYTYQWYVDDQLQTETSSSFTYASTSAGTYSVKCVATDSEANSATSNVATLTVQTGTTTTYYSVDVTCYVGGVTNPEAGIHQVESGQSFTVEATADAGYLFSRFVVDGQNVTENPYTFTVSQDVTVVARFSSELGNETVTVQPPVTPPITLPAISTNMLFLNTVIVGACASAVFVMERKKRA